MQEILSNMLAKEDLKLVGLSFILFITSLVLKKILLNKVERNETIETIEKVSLKRSVKSYVNFFLVILLLILWFSQIQAVFVSLFAVAAAIVLATKELIMSFMGGLLIKMNNHFKVGDRIEVDGVRGFVVEKTMTTTKVLEIGPEKHSQQTTGDIITVPNSVMLTKPVKNESYFKGHSIKSFTLKVPQGIKLQDFESKVLEWANDICKDYLAQAKKSIGSFCKKEGLLIPAVEPRVKIVLSEKESYELLLKLPVKNHSIGDIEQDLFRKYVTYIESLT